METTNTDPSSVLTSLRGLAELEKQRIASEQARVLDATRAKQAAEAKRQADDEERRRREEDERVAVTRAAIERTRLDHQVERAELAARRVAAEHLRAAERVSSRGSSLGLALRVAHAVATATLALGVLLALQVVRDAHRAQALLARSAADDARALGTLRADNDELTRNYGIALDAARSASRPLPAAPVSPPPVAPLRSHDAVTPPPTQRRSTGCDPHDPLCGDLP